MLESGQTHIWDDISPYIGLMAPKVTPSGALKLRTNLWAFKDPNSKELLDAPIVPMRYVEAWAAERLRIYDALLGGKFQQLDFSQNATAMEPKRSRHLTRTILKSIFPALVPSMNTSGETNLFKEQTMDQYVNSRAVPEAFRVRQWLIEAHLPPSYHQRLSLLENVRFANNLIDLVRLLRLGKKEIAETSGIIYQAGKMHHEVATLLGFSYLYALADLSRDESDNSYIQIFMDQVNDAFPQDDYVTVFVNIDNADKITSITKCTLANRAHYDQSVRNPSYNYKVELAARRFSPAGDGFFILEGNPKDPLSETFKMWRARPVPVMDRLRARFVLGDKINLPVLIRNLKERLPDWDIVEESVVSFSGVSSFRNKSVFPKYFAVLIDDPNVRLEIQIDWISDSKHTSDDPIEWDTWMAKKYLPGSHSDRHYRMKQLLGSRRNPGILPICFPYRYYDVDWFDEEVTNELFTYADNLTRSMMSRNVPARPLNIVRKKGRPEI